jgi:hypothetical protein
MISHGPSGLTQHARRDRGKQLPVHAVFCERDCGRQRRHTLSDRHVTEALTIRAGPEPIVNRGKTPLLMLWFLGRFVLITPLDVVGPESDRPHGVGVGTTGKYAVIAGGRRNGGGKARCRRTAQQALLRRISSRSCGRRRSRRCRSGSRRRSTSCSSGRTRVGLAARQRFTEAGLGLR